MARVLAKDFGCTVDIVVLGDGPLKQDFAQYGALHDLAGFDPEGEQARNLAARLYGAGARAAICNTAVSGLFLSTLKKVGFRCVSLVHEMPGIIRSYRLEEHVRRIATEADVVVFAAETVRAGFQEFSDVPTPTERVRIRPQGLYKRNRFAQDDEQGQARLALRSALGLSDSAKIVLGVGYADHRKGIDLFVQVGVRVMQARSDVAFVWVGHHDADLWPQVRRIVEQSGHAERFHFPGRVPISDTDLYYAGADVFALTSREDPFPSVVLESLEVGVPVVAFVGTGGCCDLIQEGCGLLAPAFDVDAYAGRILELLDNEAQARSFGSEGARRIREDFSFRSYMYDMAAWLQLLLRRVSAIVPTFNYGRYLKERLHSIARQTYPVFEIIVLDDASTDDSVRIARELLPSLSIDARLIVNADNSGSVFKQWRKGVELARGEIVWIAEADDLADPRFLEELVPDFEDRSVVLAYSQSKQMATDGTILCEHYLDYTSDISPDKWSRPYSEHGLSEISTALAVKNTIPNVSAVLFSRESLVAALISAEQELLKYRIAGDWVVYIEVLKRGRISFTPIALNYHRRHQSSVTIGSFDISQLREIVAVQRKVQREFPVSDATRKKADSYAQKLFVDFGLVLGDVNNYRQHPLITAVLESEEMCPSRYLSSASGHSPPVPSNVDAAIVSACNEFARATGVVADVHEQDAGSHVKQRAEPGRTLTWEEKMPKYRRVFYLGAPYRVDLPKDAPVDKLREATGGNTGNLLIGDAIRRHLKLGEMYCGDLAGQDPRFIEDNFDCIVIGAANFLYERFDLGAYVSFLERVRLPAVIIGLGAQAPCYESRVNVPEATKRMMKIISERSTTLGVRGWFTASVLNDMGIQNIRVIGCPSIYWTCSPQIQILRAPECRAIAVNGSANQVGAHSADPLATMRVEASLAGLAYRNNYPYILQNEWQLIALATGSKLELDLALVRSLMDQYGLSTIREAEFIRFVKECGRVFFSVDEWMDYIKMFDFVIGTRLHGCLIALLAGRPAYVFVRDTRTQEMCELLKIPHCDMRNVGSIDPECLYRAMDLNATTTAYASLYMNYVEFLEENGLKHSLPKHAPEAATEMASSRQQWGVGASGEPGAEGS